MLSSLMVVGLYPRQQCVKAPLSLQPHHLLVLMTGDDHSDWGEGKPPCMALMLNDSEHFSTCLLDICISYLKTYHKILECVFQILVYFQILHPRSSYLCGRKTCSFVDDSYCHCFI